MLRYNILYINSLKENNMIDDSPVKTLNSRIPDELLELEESDEIKEHLDKIKNMTDEELKEFYDQLIGNMNSLNIKKSGSGYTKTPRHIKSKQSKTKKKNQILARKKLRK